MRYLIFTFISFYGLTISLSSCGPDEGMDCKVICDKVNSAPQELLSTFVFKEGSYWVYQLKGTNTLDTLSFMGMESEYFEKKAGCNYGIPPCEMRYSISFKHSNQSKFPPGNLKNNTSNEGYYFKYSQTRDQWDVSHVAGNKGLGSLGFFLAYPYIPNQQFEETKFLNDTASIINVPAGIFKCLQTESKVVDPEGVIMSMYWSKGIGLIQYQISTNQIWELINFHHN